MEKTMVYLTLGQRHRLREVARRTGRSQADVIRAAIDAWLDAQGPARPRSIGAGSDEGLSAEASEAWLRRRWRDG